MRHNDEGFNDMVVRVDRLSGRLSEFDFQSLAKKVSALETKVRSLEKALGKAKDALKALGVE
jgi:hypothetical protein